MKTKIFSLLSLLGLLALPAGAVTTSGPITGSETWSGTVTLTGDVTVTETGNLTILPGTVVKCDPNADDQVGGDHTSRIEIIVEGGTLKAEGTAASPILFTSAAASPQKGDWYGIQVNSDGVKLRYCVVQYGWVGLTVKGGALSASQCIFEKCSSHGVQASASVEMPECQFRENGGSGINGTNVTMTLNNCRMQKNAGAGVSGSNVTVRAMGTTLSENNGDGIGISGQATLENCAISKNRGTGVNVSGGGSNTATLSNCTVSSNGGTGVNVSSGCRSANTATLSNCTVSNNTGTGVNVSGGGSNTATLSNCTVSSNGGTGVNSNTAKVTDCTVKQNQGNGVYTDSVSMVGSVVSGNGGTGVRLTAIGPEGFGENLIRGNRVGIEVQSSAPKWEFSAPCDILGNSDYELKNAGSAAIIANDCYWGEPTTTELNNKVFNLTKIYDSRDNANVGQVAIRRWRTQAVTGPVIDSLSPTSGGAGTEVTILGQRFGSDPTVVSVTFNGVAATVNSLTDTEIKATVPAQATTGPVVVTRDGLPSNSDQTFTVLLGVTAISPDKGNRGQTVNATLTGSGFAAPATVKLKQGSTEVAGTNVTVKNAGELTANFALAADQPTGLYDVVVTSGGQTATLTNGFEVVAHGPATQIDLTSDKAVLPANGTATTTLRATLKDAQGNVALTATNPVTFTIQSGGDSGTLQTTDPVTPVNGVATNVLTATTTPGTVRVEAAASGLTGDTVAVEVAAGYLELTANPTELTADGTSESTLTATVRTGDGNVDTGFNQPITFALTEGAASGTLVGTNPATPANGVATIQLRAKTKAGTVTATASATGVASGTATVTVKPGPAAKVGLTANPASIRANGTDTTAIVATIQDTNGNVVPDYAGNVTFAVTAGGASGELQGNTTVAIESGRAAITLKATTTAGTVTVEATSGSLTKGTLGVPVTAIPTDFTLTASPASLAATGSATTTLTVTILDAAGQRVAGAANEVTFTVVGGTASATLPVQATVNAVDGMATITLTATTTPGRATVRAIVKDVPPPGGKTVDVEVVGGKISGQVTKRDGTTPVVGATVQALVTGTTTPVVAEATTGSDGRYSLLNLGSGSYDVTVSQAGYLSQTVVGRTVTAPDETANVDFRLYPAPMQLGGGKAEPASIPADGKATSVISVELRDAEGQKVPVATNKVTFSVTQGANSVTLPSQTEVTPVDGVARLTVTATTTPGTVKLKAEAEGLTATEITLTVAGGALSGKVFAADGTTALAEATVDLLRAGTTEVVKSTPSGSDGSYRFADLSGGTYDVRASKPGYLSQTVTGKAVTPGQETGSVNFSLSQAPTQLGGGKAEPASIPADGKATSVISVELRDADGQKVPAATNKVTFSVTQGANSVTLPSQMEVTPVDGVARLTVTATTTPGNVTIKAEAEGLGETNLNLAVTGTSVRGTVTRYTDGAALSEVTVEAKSGGNVLASATTGSDGTYTLTGLGSGTVELVATKGGFVPARRADVAVEASQTTSGQDFALVKQPDSFAGLDLMTVPFTFADPRATAVLGSGTRVAGYDNGQYVFDNVSVAAGRGFWAKPSPDPLAIREPGTLADQTAEALIDLSPGWSLVGSPFLSNVPWANTEVQTTSGRKSLTEAAKSGQVALCAWGWEPNKREYQLIYPQASLPGLTIADTVLRPWRGYWVKAGASVKLVLPPPSRRVGVWERERGRATEARGREGAETSTPPHPHTPTPGDWAVQLVAQVGDLRDSANYCGVNGTAGLEGRSANGDLRIESPPPMSPFVDLFFVGGTGHGAQGTESVTRHSDRYALDLRGRAAERLAWDFVVETDVPEGEVVLTWPHLRQVPADVQLTLTDVETGERIPLRTRAAYRYRSPSLAGGGRGQGMGVRRFRLEATPRRAGLAITNLTTMPARGGATAITFTLSQPATAWVTVLSAAGRVVAELDGFDRRTAGVQTMAWDGRDTQGRPVPNGVYLLRVVATTEEGERVQVVRTVRVGW